MEDALANTEQIDTALNAALNSYNVPKLYANSFIVSTTTSDFVLVSQLNGVPVQVMNVSFTSLKSLSIAIDKTIKNFENKTGIDIITADQVQETVYK